MNINKTMQDAFNAQISQELYSSNLYLQMAFWFRKEGWKGFATWMAKQSDEEKQHAMDMADFVLNRGGEVKLTAIEAVPTEWGSPKEVFEATMAHEQLISSLIDKVEEERSVRDILNLFRHRDGHTVANIDDILGTRPE